MVRQRTVYRGRQLNPEPASDAAPVHGVDLMPGMVVTADDGITSKELVVADLAVTVLDPTADTVTGTAPLWATWLLVMAGNETPGCLLQVTVTAGPTAIADGQSDAVAFGDGAQGQADSTRTFTVRNDGGSTLHLGTLSVPYGFSVVTWPASALG